MATPVGRLTDSLYKAKHINDITNFLGVRNTEIFKIKTKVTCKYDAVLIIDTTLKKKRRFVEKHISVIVFVLLGGGRYTQ